MTTCKFRSSCEVTAEIHDRVQLWAYDNDDLPRLDVILRLSRRILNSIKIVDVLASEIMPYASIEGIASAKIIEAVFVVREDMHQKEYCRQGWREKGPPFRKPTANVPLEMFSYQVTS